LEISVLVFMTFQRDPSSWRRADICGRTDGSDGGCRRFSRLCKWAWKL